ncbi:DUF3298 domain-containing protein [Neolewinella agarilytica]|nr:DUF3298 domain-containing protein [Neolewinella agarilytica]
MRFLFLLLLLFMFRCGSPPPQVPDATSVVVNDKKTPEATMPTEPEEEATTQEEVVEEEPLRIWDRAWPEMSDRRDRQLQAKTEGGMPLHRLFVTDTITLYSEEDFEANAIFVSLIDLAAGPNGRINDQINTQIIQCITEGAVKKGDAEKRLRAFAKQTTRAFQRELKADEDADVYSALHHAVTTTLKHNDASFLMLSLESYVYGGGANGGFYRDDLTFSTKTGKRIELKDVILRNRQADFLAALNASALAGGHENVDLPLPDNFLFTPEGISLHYPEYSAGLSNRWATDLVVSYVQLDGLLTVTGLALQRVQQEE